MASAGPLLALACAVVGAWGVEVEEVEAGSGLSCSAWVDSDNIRRVASNDVVSCAKVAAASPACGDFFSYSPGQPAEGGSCKCVAAGDACRDREADDGYQLYQITSGQGEGEAPSIILASCRTPVPTNSAGEPCRDLDDHCCDGEDYCCDPLVARWENGTEHAMTPCGVGSSTCGHRFLCGDGVVPLPGTGDEEKQDNNCEDGEDSNGEDADERGSCSQGKYDCQAAFEAGNGSPSYCDTKYGCVLEGSSCPCGGSNGTWVDDADEHGPCSHGRYDCQAAFVASGSHPAHCDTEYGCVLDGSTCPCVSVRAVVEMEGLSANRSCSRWVDSDNIRRVASDDVMSCAKVAAASSACGQFFSYSPGNAEEGGSCKCVVAGDACSDREADAGYQLYQITAGKGMGEAPNILLYESDELPLPTNNAGEPCRDLDDHCCNGEDYCCDPLVARWEAGDEHTMTPCRVGSPKCGRRFLCGDGVVPLPGTGDEEKQDNNGEGDEDNNGQDDGESGPCSQGKYDCQAAFEAGNGNPSYCDTKYGCVLEGSSCPCGGSNDAGGDDADEHGLCSQGKYDCQAAFEAGDGHPSWCDTEYGCVLENFGSSCPCGAVSSGNRVDIGFQAWLILIIVAAAALNWVECAHAFLQ